MAESTTLEVLTRVRDRLSDPAAWCKGYLAYRPWGKGRRKVQSDDPKANQWCLIGALEKEERPGGHYYLDQARAALSACLPYGFGQSIPAFNDARETTHADILGVLNCAIARVTAKETDWYG